FGEAKALRDGGKLEPAREKLEEAALDYLRVTAFYSTDVEDDTPVLRSLDNQGRVFLSLFEITGAKNTDLLEKASRSYWDIYNNSSADAVAKREAAKQLRTIDDRKKAAQSDTAAPG